MSNAQTPATPATAATLRDAASVVLLRDGREGLEVLLMQRPTSAKVLGGWFVFPGGKLDEADCAPDWAAHLDTPPQPLAQRLNEGQLPTHQAQGLYVAALRELFEEAGVLLAQSPSAAAKAAELAAAAPQVRAQGVATGVQGGWLAWMQSHQLQWQTQGLQPWSRWITPHSPVMKTARFDTRFFLARMPTDQTVQADTYEVAHHLWLTPREALQRHWVGEMPLTPPQLMGLAQLARHPSVDSALHEAAQRPVPCILPELIAVGHDRGMCYPGDPLHSVPQRALPGPTRLRVDQQRFEPFNGFDGWFA
jgi:8-oxo-dGTP pyrophosphatase MutT (NUDIX family)